MFVRILHYLEVLYFTSLSLLFFLCVNECVTVRVLFVVDVGVETLWMMDVCVCDHTLDGDEGVVGG